MAAQTEEAKAKVILDGKQANATIKEMENAVKQLTAEWRNCAKGSQELADKSKEIQKLNTSIVDTKTQTKAMTEEMKRGQFTMEGMFANLKEKVLEFGGALLAAFAVDKMAEYFKEGIKKAVELKDTENILLLVLDKNKSSQKELIGLARERAGVTTNGRLEIEQAEKFLAIQQRTPDQIRKTIVAAQDLAVVTGQSLQSAVEELDATMEGRMGKGLLKLSAGFKDLTKDQLYNGAAIDMIGAKYAGLAEDEAKTTGGMIIMAEKSWSVLQRTLGEYILGSGTFYQSALQGAKSWFDSITGHIARLNEENKSAVKKFEELSTSVGQLVNETTPLLSRYDELSSKTNLSSDEQGELKKIIGDVTAVMPGAADAFDKYGNAISISSDKVRDYIKNQIILLQYTNKKAIEETQKDLDKANKELKIHKPDIESIQSPRGTYTISSGYHDLEMRDATQAEVGKEMAANQERLNNQIAITLKLGVLRGDSLQAAIDNFKKEKEARDKEAADSKKSVVDVSEFKKKTIDELQHFVDAGAVMGATETEKRLAASAKTEIDHRTNDGKKTQEHLDKIQESYKNLMDSIKEMEGKNYADKLTQTQAEIRQVEEKYDAMIKKALKYKEDNAKLLTPAQKTEIDDNVTKLQIARTTQVNQVLIQAEQKFSDDVKLIHENLRVARLSITQRQLYEVKKKYDDARKEILGAVDFKYAEEIKAANGDAAKIISAAEHKAESLKKIQKDIDKLKYAERQENKDVREAADLKFTEDLNNLKLKSDRALAEDKIKIQLEVNAKYKKLLDANLHDSIKTNEIKEQMDHEVADRTIKLNKENVKKFAESAVSVANAAVGGLSQIFSMQNNMENDQLKIDEQNNTEKKDNLKKQLDSGIINKTQYDARVGKMDADIAAKKKKMDHDQAERAKEIALFNALINVAAAVAAALTAGPGTGIVLSIITAALGAVQVGYILNQKVPQAAAGRYSVIGQDDNKLYKDVPMVPNPATGLYTSPTLISETGGEFVIDPATTKNLMVNYPHVIDAIQHARVAQFATGSYPTSTSQAQALPPGQSDKNDELLSAIKELNNHAKNGLRSYMVYSDFRIADDKMRVIESDVSKQ